MSCLFNSLSSFIQNVNSTQLREMICDFLDTNPLLLDDDNETRASELLGGEQELRTHISQMRRPQTWGSAMEIKAFCDLFSAVVKVKVLSTGKWIEFLPRVQQQEPATFHISWNGGHYEPLR